MKHHNKNNHRKKNNRNKLKIGYILAILLIVCIFIGFSYYSIRYSITLIQWEEDGLQKYNGYCIGYDTRYISTARKMYNFRLENGDTVQMSSTLLSESSFDEDEFLKLVENHTPMEVSYTNYYIPIVGIFAKNYGLVSLKVSEEVIVSDSIMHRELLWSAILYGVLALVMLMIPVVNHFQRGASITSKQERSKRKCGKNNKTRGDGSKPPKKWVFLIATN